MKHRYIKVNPRGFANEYTIYRVPADKVAEAEAEYDGFEDRADQGGYTAWVDAPTSRWDAVDWADRRW
jgi:hypothetical protein